VAGKMPLAVKTWRNPHFWNFGAVNDWRRNFVQKLFIFGNKKTCSPTFSLLLKGSRFRPPDTSFLFLLWSSVKNRSKWPRFIESKTSNSLSSSSSACEEFP
jgi:hypothetical protein